MQYVDGTDLAAVLRAGPVQPDRAVHIIAQVARALDHAHAAGVLHRDVKPANILLARTGDQVFLADFGIAKVLDQVGDATRTGQLYASFRYAAPEQFDTTRAVDGRADVYALGGTLYHLLTGTPPYPGDNAGQLLHGHLNLPVPQPSSIRHGLPAGFDVVVDSALAKNPDHRFASCAELAIAAQQALTGQTVQTPLAAQPVAGTAESIAAPMNGAAAHSGSFPAGRDGQASVAHRSFSGGGVAVGDPPAGGPPDAGSGAPEKNSVRRWSRRILAVFGWLALLTGIAGVALYYGSWPFMTFVLAASFASYFMVAAPIAAVLFACARRWRTALAALFVTAAAVWSQLPMALPDGTAPSGVDVAVMQSNLLFGGADLDAVVRTVRDNDIDVLTLDELTPEAFRGVQSAGLLDELPYYYVETASGGAGGGIFSRYELTGAENLTGFLNRNVRVTMIHPELGPVTVFQFHPMPPNLDFDAWRRELRTIRDLLDQTPGKVIVGGDFNATYDHAPFRDLLRGRYADSAELLGVGALPTWPDGDSMGSLTEAGPFIGIDRVLVAGGHATDIHTVTIPGTDHRAVVARLRL